MSGKPACATVEELVWGNEILIIYMFNNLCSQNYIITVNSSPPPSQLAHTIKCKYFLGGLVIRKISSEHMHNVCLNHSRLVSTRTQCSIYVKHVDCE